MTQVYCDPDREDDPHALPDVEVFELTAREVAEMEEDLIWEYSRRPEYRLANISTKTRDYMFYAMIKQEGIKGGWFYHYCLPGCLPDSEPFGPFATRDEAIKDAQDNA